MTGSDLLKDETLARRGHFWKLSHPEMGDLYYSGPAYRLELTPSELTSAPPCLGADTDDVLQSVLMFDPEKIKDLRDSGVLT